MKDDSYIDLFRAVIYRALYDALGLTGLSKNSEEHWAANAEAKLWFINDVTDLEICCELANLDFRKIRASCIKLIEARQSGDFSRIPKFWRDCFRRNRAPSYGVLQKTIDQYLDVM